MKFSNVSYESAARCIYLTSIIFTIFAPAVHYTGYVLTLGLLVYGRIRHKEPIVSFNDKTCRDISIALTAFFLWSAFINVFFMTDFETWGKGASVYLELLVGYFFAVRLFSSEESRKTFIRFFVPLTTFIFCLIIIKAYVPLPFALPKRLTMNGNTLGLYPVLAVPYIFFYSMWIWEKRCFLKYFSCIVSMVTLFISFASGAWLTVFCMLPFILYYAVRAGKIKLISIAAGIFAGLMVLVAFNYVSGGAIQKRFEVELRQISSVKDANSLTNHRSAIWRIVSGLVADRPIAGYGRKNLEEVYGQALKENAEYAKLDFVARSHAHNMYLELAVSSGIPSMLLFLAALAMMLKKCWRGRFRIENGVPWHLIFLVMLGGQLIYGLTGDVFEARRDLAVIFWASMGIIAALPSAAEKENDCVQHTFSAE